MANDYIDITDPVYGAKPTPSTNPYDTVQAALNRNAFILALQNAESTQKRIYVPGGDRFDVDTINTDPLHVPPYKKIHIFGDGAAFSHVKFGPEAIDTSRAGFNVATGAEATLIGIHFEGPDEPQFLDPNDPSKSKVVMNMLHMDQAAALMRLIGVRTSKAFAAIKCEGAGGACAIADSPAGATQSGSVVTIKTIFTHGFAIGNSVTITGATVAGYNGTFPIASIPDPNSFTYNTVAGLAPSGGTTKTIEDPAGATESGPNVKITTTMPHGLQPGDLVTITGVSVPGYNGVFKAAFVPTPTSFIYANNIPNLASAVGGIAVYRTGSGGIASAESGTMATIRTTAPNGFAIGNSVTITGVAVAGYNGTFTVVSVVPKTNLFTYFNHNAGLAPSGMGTAQVGATTANIGHSQPGATQSDSTVTITTTTPHGFAVGDTVMILGVGVSSYNGTFTIVSVTATSFTYDTDPGLPPSGGGTAQVGIADSATSQILECIDCDINYSVEGALLASAVTDTVSAEARFSNCTFNAIQLPAYVGYYPPDHDIYASDVWSLSIDRIKSQTGAGPSLRLTADSRVAPPPSNLKPRYLQVSNSYFRSDAGVQLNGRSPMNLVNCTFEYWNAGIEVREGGGVVMGCTFRNRGIPVPIPNSPRGGGGAILEYSIIPSQPLHVIGCTFSGGFADNTSEAYILRNRFPGHQGRWVFKGCIFGGTPTDDGVYATWTGVPDANVSFEDCTFGDCFYALMMVRCGKLSVRNCTILAGKEIRVFEPNTSFVANGDVEVDFYDNDIAAGGGLYLWDDKLTNYTTHSITVRGSGNRFAAGAGPRIDASDNVRLGWMRPVDEVGAHTIASKPTILLPVSQSTWHVTGSETIETIALEGTNADRIFYGPIRLIADGPWLLGNTGNIRPSTSMARKVNEVVELIHDPKPVSGGAAGLWYEVTCGCPQAVPAPPPPPSNDGGTGPPPFEVCEKLAARIGQLGIELMNETDAVKKAELEKELGAAQQKYARDCAGHARKH
jgi:hypothetical protein